MTMTAPAPPLSPAPAELEALLGPLRAYFRNRLEGDQILMSCVGIGTAFDLPEGVLRKRLAAWMKDNPGRNGVFVEQEPRKNRPRIYYELGAVLPIIEDLLREKERVTIRLPDEVWTMLRR